MFRRSKKTLIVAFNHVNACDHIVPIIWKWSEQEDNPSVVAVPESVLHAEDYRIEFLKQLDRVKLVAQEPVVQMIREADNEKEGADRALSHLLAEGLPGILAFDRSGGMRHIHSLCLAAKKRNMLRIALPHGDHPFVSERLLDDDTYISKRGPKINKENLLQPKFIDFLCYGSPHHPKMIHEGFPVEKRVMGSSRFSQEWINVFENISPRTSAPFDRDKIRIVLMLRDTRYSIFWQEIERIIEIIGSMEKICLVVYLHSRNKKNVENISIGSGKQSQHMTSTIIYLHQDLAAAELLNWGNVFLSLGTGLAFHALRTEKAVYELEYCCAYNLMLSQIAPECRIGSRDELINALQKICEKNSQGEHLTFPLQGNRKRFVEEVLDPHGNALDRYMELFKNGKI